MTVTLATSKTYAVPSDGVQLVVTASESSANIVRLLVTSAPDGSTLAQQLEQSGTAAAGDRGSPEALIELDVTQPDGWQLDMPQQHVLPLDVGGVYTFKALEIARGGVTYGGGYAGDPLGYPSETVLATTSSVTVEVGTRLTAPIGVPPYGTAQLIMWAWGDNIRATTAAEHGEATPAIASPQGQGAVLAAQDSTVETALAALDGYDLTTLQTELATLAQAFKDELPAHFADASAHRNADADNDSALENLPESPATPEGWAQVASIVATQLRRHMTNSKSVGTAWGSERYHAGAGDSPAQPDTENLPVALGGAFSPGNMAITLAQFADLHRAYEDHRDDTDFHVAADSTNTLPALGVLLDLHGTFLARSAALDSAPATVSDGVTAAIRVAGFTRA